MKPPVFPLRAAAALFVARQHLDRPRGQRLGARTLERFVSDVGGLQIDSINVLDRAHYLTAWSRFGAYDHAALDRLIYRKRVLFEYWAHAACFVPSSQLVTWRRVMLDYKARHTGWSAFLRKNKNRRVTEATELAIRERGPLANADFEHVRPGKGAGWWDWKPAAHALHGLWMTGRTLVHSRVHFQKRFDIAERVLPTFAAGEPPSWDEFMSWHIRRSLHAMGAATETDLNWYLTFPRIPATMRKKKLNAMLKSGEVVEVEIEGSRVRWVALPEDLPALEKAARSRRAPSQGTTLLSPFDSFLWHRARTQRLFGFDYTIEVYVPGPKRKFGYYVLPIWHDAHLIGRLDAKHHRSRGVLEVRRVHFEPWLVAGKAPPAAAWGAVDLDAALVGIGETLSDLARFLGAERVSVGRVAPGKLRAPLARAVRESLGHKRTPITRESAGSDVPVESGAAV